ncbi:MAG: ABC transporter permease [Gemmataceae bacterium]|nr:ABC transporter permease [Gemmataceae bacterium]
MNLLQTLGRGIWFFLQGIRAIPASLGQPTELLLQSHKALAGCLLLSTLAGAAAGIVAWIHLRNALVNVAGPSAVSYLPQALGLAVVLEFAPLSAALILAGRVGSSLAAELASMKQTEQIDAMVLLGFPPMVKLVAPRLLACALVLPLLAVITVWLAILAGFFAEFLGGSMTWTQYHHEVLRVLNLKDALPALAKTFFFGLAVGAAGCFHGMESEGGTEGVGKAATQGVATSIFLVLFLNVILVKTFQTLIP